MVVGWCLEPQLAVRRGGLIRGHHVYVRVGLYKVCGWGWQVWCNFGDDFGLSLQPDRYLCNSLWVFCLRLDFSIMLEKEVPFILESTLNALLNSSSLIPWFTKGDERCTQVTLRFYMNDNHQPFMKFRRSPPSRIKKDANRAKDAKQSNPVLRI